MMDNWEECIFCKRLWDATNLELELCQDCYTALARNPDHYDAVRLQQYLEYGEFKDLNLAEAVKLLYKVYNEKKHD